MPSKRAVRKANIEYDVLAVRGIASMGPMHKYTKMVKTMAKEGCILLHSLSVPPTLATATTPSTGKQTAVRAIPRKAGRETEPA